MDMMATAFPTGDAVEVYMSTISGAIRERSDAYDEGEAIWSLAAFAIGLAVALLLYQTGFVKGLRDRLEGSLPRWLAVFPFIIVYTLVVTIITFPLDLWLGFFREHRFGLSTQDFGAWMSQYLISFAISLLLSAIAIGILYYVIRALKKTWWLWGAGLAVIALAALMTLAPVYLSPIFNDYTPMEDGPLKNDILLMGQAAGVPADNVYVYDQSRQTNTISANVSGMFGTTRISLADTLINDATPAEVRAVMAHEIGHYVLNHIWEMIIVFGVLIAIGFAFVHATFSLVAGTIGRGWGIRDIGDIAGMPLLFALLGLYAFLITPLTNTMIRTNETEADIFGLALAREPDGFAAVAMKLGAYRKLDPGPVERFIFHDHPTGRDRVTMAMEFKAAELAAGAPDMDPAVAPLADEVRRYVAEREAEKETAP